MTGLETKFCRFDAAVTLDADGVIEGYASRFGAVDQGGDVVEAGAFGASLERLAARGQRVKMLWQHDPAQPIGVWDAVAEDATGLKVRGRLLADVARGREARALVEAGAIDGLSIGYRVARATKAGDGTRRLNALDLWEVSLVTFPMLPSARVGAKAEEPAAEGLRAMADLFREARDELGAAQI